MNNNVIPIKRLSTSVIQPEPIISADFQQPHKNFYEFFRVSRHILTLFVLSGLGVPEIHLVARFCFA